MSNHINAWWPKEPFPGNFGDILTPYLVKKITGKTPRYVNKDFNMFPVNLLAVGSVIRNANKNTVVWGSGAMSMSDSLSPHADYRAVRGPLTRESVLRSGVNCPEIYGDPALLMPKFYTPKTTKRYRYGIIPHYVDYEQVVNWFRKDPSIKVINLLNDNVERVIDEINECENVISSSLHGIIAAHAYGVNAVWAKFSDKLFGDGTKFRDYFASVGVEMDCIILNDKPTIENITAMPYVGNIVYNGDALLNAFPHDKF